MVIDTCQADADVGDQESRRQRFRQSGIRDARFTRPTGQFIAATCRETVLILIENPPSLLGLRIKRFPFRLRLSSPRPSLFINPSIWSRIHPVALRAKPTSVPVGIAFGNWDLFQRSADGRPRPDDSRFPPETNGHRVCDHWTRRRGAGVNVSPRGSCQFPETISPSTPCRSPGRPLLSSRPESCADCRGDGPPGGLRLQATCRSAARPSHNDRHSCDGSSHLAMEH